MDNNSETNKFKTSNTEQEQTIAKGTTTEENPDQLKIREKYSAQYARFQKPSFLKKMYGIVPMILFAGVTALFLLTSCASVAPYKQITHNTLNLTQFSPVFINTPVSSFENKTFNDEQYKTLVSIFKEQGYNVVDNPMDSRYQIYVNVVNIFTAKQFTSSIQRGLSLETYEEAPNKRTPPRKPYKTSSIQPTNYTYIYMQSYIPINSAFQDRKVLVWEGSANVQRDEYQKTYAKILNKLVNDYGRELRRNTSRRNTP